MMPPANVPEQRNDQPYPAQYMVRPHPTGQYGPMSSMWQQEDYVNQYNQELFRQYGGGGVLMTNTVPTLGLTSPPLSGRSSPYAQTRSPVGICTPMADVNYTGWAQPPNNHPMDGQQGPCPSGSSNEGDGIADFPTPLAKPHPKRKINQAQNQHIHGERVMIAADSMRLWSRLDEDIPSGPRNPAE